MSLGFGESPKSRIVVVKRRSLGARWRSRKSWTEHHDFFGDPTVGSGDPEKFTFSEGIPTSGWDLGGPGSDPVGEPFGPPEIAECSRKKSFSRLHSTKKKFCLCFSLFECSDSFVN